VEMNWRLQNMIAQVSGQLSKRSQEQEVM